MAEKRDSWYMALRAIGMPWHAAKDHERPGNVCVVCTVGCDYWNILGGYLVCPGCSFKSAAFRRNDEAMRLAEIALEDDGPGLVLRIRWPRP